MTHSGEFDHFCRGIATFSLSETQKAVACLWFADHFSSGAELSLAEIANHLQSSGLTGKVNVSRLRKRLSKSRDAHSGEKSGNFRLALRPKPELDRQFLPLLKHRRVSVSDVVLPLQIVEHTRSYLCNLAHQINGCYDNGFFDACAVLCRRIVESLLIDAFERAGHRTAIEDPNGNLVGLDEMVRHAKSGKFIRLERGTGKVLDKVKEIGDTAAHDRYHITSEQDIAEFGSGFRRIISELLTLAGITSDLSMQ
jgi:hypothetical protein